MIQGKRMLPAGSSILRPRNTSVYCGEYVILGKSPCSAVTNVGRDFKAHAERAGIKFTAKFTVHTFRKTCAQNRADRLPANVVKFYLGHSDMNTTNKFYCIVDQSHLDLTRNVMDEMLENGKKAE